MIRLLGTLGDLPIVIVCQTLPVLGYMSDSRHAHLQFGQNLCDSGRGSRDRGRWAGGEVGAVTDPLIVYTGSSATRKGGMRTEASGSPRRATGAAHAVAVDAEAHAARRVEADGAGREQTGRVATGAAFCKAGLRR